VLYLSGLGALRGLVPRGYLFARRAQRPQRLVCWCVALLSSSACSAVWSTGPARYAFVGGFVQVGVSRSARSALSAVGHELSLFSVFAALSG